MEEHGGKLADGAMASSPGSAVGLVVSLNEQHQGDRALFEVLGRYFNHK